MSNLDPLKEVVNSHGLQCPRRSLAICYGSTVRAQSERSDLDMLIVEHHASPSTWRDTFTNKLINLHLALGRAIDEEVPYENKLFYTGNEVASGLSHDMFWKTDNAEQFSIRTFLGAGDSDPYFASPDMKQRLCLNAFTTSHQFLGGNKTWYARIRRAATISLGHLATQIVGEEAIRAPLNEVCTSLVASGDATYKDFLGYTAEDAYFRRTLGHGLADVRLQNKRGMPILGPDGHHFLQGRVHELLVGMLDNA